MHARLKWYGLKPVLPVASGGLHPRLVPALLETFGNDVVLQAGGGIHGHPDGTIGRRKSDAASSRCYIKGLTIGRIR